MNVRKRRLLWRPSACFLLAWSVTQVGISAERIEHQQISSQVFQDAGAASNQRDISIYVPRGYDESQSRYPVLYLLHGGWWLNVPNASQVFLGGGYSGTMSDANVATIADRLIEEQRIPPLIIVMPDLSMPWQTPDDFSDDMALAVRFIQSEVAPYIDGNYRTIRNRSGRTIAGHSDGGHGATFIGLTLPAMFSRVVAYSETLYAAHRNLVFDHDQVTYPVEFWLYAGSKDEYAPYVEEFAGWLDAAGLPYEFMRDDGDHVERIGERLEQSLLFLAAGGFGSQPIPTE
jgi:enterochelin esterase-like enzyme